MVLAGKQKLVGLLMLFGMLLLLCSGCSDGPRNRPYGVIRLGSISELSGSETFLPNLRLIIRRDDKGYYAMSTLCTYDLAPLYKRENPSGSYILFSKFSESEYSHTGDVLKGPSKFSLPYYELELREGVYGGPIDTLYAVIGPDVGREWRLSLGRASEGIPATSSSESAAPAQ